MAGRNIVSEVEGLLRPVVEGAGFELYDLEFVKEGANWYLRVYIDTPGGVTIDNCEAASRAVEKALDDSDPIEQSYVLEVSSPGIDRPLKKEADFVKFQGSVVDIKLYKPVGGKKTYQGTLEGLRDGNIVISGGSGCPLSFPKSDVALCRPTVAF